MLIASYKCVKQNLRGETMKAITLISTILLVNSTTLFAAPFVRPNPPTYIDHGPGYNRPVPVRPNPRPIRPTPVPVYPGYPTHPGYPSHPVYPAPVYPTPVYPGPVYPTPGYPIPVEPPYNPNPRIQKTIYLNRYVQYESINLTQAMALNYSYQGYRVRQVYVDVSDANGARIDLLINNRVVDSKNSYGSDVYLYPNYNDELYYEVSDLRVGITGGAYVNRITVELERY